MNPKTQKKLTELIRQSSESSAAVSVGVIEESRAVEKGALYIFELPVEVPVQWCAVFTHPDNDQLWFTVPGDEFSLVGTKDIEVPDSAPGGPLNLRCANGVWIHSDDFVGSNQFGRLDIVFVEQVRDRLSRMLDDDMPNADYLSETDTDPDYVGWIEELSFAVAAFENRLECSDSTVTSVVYRFTENWIDSVPGVESMPSALAADAADLAKIPETESSSAAPTGTVIEFDGPGDLVAIRYDHGLVFQIYNLPDDAKPPTIVANELSLEWEKFGTWYATVDVEWIDDQVEFSINGDKWPCIER